MELLTVREAAALLKVAPITIRRYVADGRLAAVRVGRGVRLTREAVEKFAKPLTKGQRRQVRLPEGRPFTKDDSLWNLVGIWDEDGPTDVSQNKHKYLAEAYGDLHDK